jgi:hypothetical protein
MPAGLEEDSLRPPVRLPPLTSGSDRFFPRPYSRY